MAIDWFDFNPVVARRLSYGPAMYSWVCLMSGSYVNIPRQFATYRETLYVVSHSIYYIHLIASSQPDACLVPRKLPTLHRACDRVSGRTRHRQHPVLCTQDGVGHALGPRYNSDPLSRRFTIDNARASNKPGWGDNSHTSSGRWFRNLGVTRTDWHAQCLPLDCFDDYSSRFLHVNETRLRTMALTGLQQMYMYTGIETFAGLR